MGNSNTNLKIDHFFDEDIQYNDKIYYVKINLERPAANRYGNYRNYLYLRMQNARLDILDYIDNDDSEYEYYEFTPKTHMRDFEVIVDDNIKIARGQGICVVIIPQANSYVKLIYETSSDHGVIPSVFSVWYNSQETKDILSSDLSIGYDVLIINNGKEYNLCEEIDERDSKETPIYFKEFEKYGNYED